MADATLSQGHHVLGLILRENDPHQFMQNLHANWGAVQTIGRGEATQSSIKEALTHLNPYANEKVEPKFFYPEGYKPATVEEQVGRLRSRYDWLDDSHVAELAASWSEYEQADGLYIIPKPSSLAVHVGVENPWDNFGLLTEAGPISALAAAWTESGGTFRNYRTNQMGSEYYRLSKAAQSVLQGLEAQQSGDLLVFPAQTGKLYAGYSVRNSRACIQQAEGPAQWPLPSYVVGFMLYATPQRLTRYEDLAIDAPGDEYSFGVDGHFHVALCFIVNDDGLYFAHRFLGYAHGEFGSASGFSRQ
ncbi:hypothetical protein HYZ78_03080 [Candidatus Microgenomates bacterium]|nr:hypothetical protein [Candidatus Microgenomates bacterium]